MSLPVHAQLDVMVPAYFHPATNPDAWQRLIRLGPALRLVIVNMHNGPGAGPDPCYRDAISQLRAARIRLVGYVDTDYGARPPQDVAADVDAYLRWYELDGIFFDQVSAQLADLDRYAQCVLAARAAGARQVVLNPGTHPHPGYADLANLTVTFEGSWRDYQALRLPSWVHRHRPSRFCHLIHSVPHDAFDDATNLAAGRHVRTVFLTDGCGANPWDHLPAPLAGAARAHLRNQS